MGRQTSTVTNGVTTTSTFNAYGKPLTQSMPHTTGAWYYTTTEYDSMGRAISVTAPDGSVTTSAFDGLTTSVTDDKSHTHTTVTDILGRTRSVTPPTGPAVAFTYDPLGNLLTATRGGASTMLTYDKAGRKTSMNDADMGTWDYSYDALGNMVTQTDARGCVTTLQYDILNRPTNKSYSNCPSSVSITAPVTYTYDVGANGKGRRTSMNDGSGSAAWVYDSRRRMIKETKAISGNSFVTEWGYNLADLPIWMKYPDGETVTTAYDNRMLAVSVTGNDSYVLDTQYDTAGRMTNRALGNGLAQTYTYYPWNQQGGRLKILSAGSLQNMTYAYDSTGNISTITDSINSLTQSFAYDALDRLTSASASGTQAQGAYSETYQYDPVTGNLKIKGDLTLNYADANHKHAVTSANGNTYSYDSNGNQTTRNIGGDTFALTYDAENRLTQVKKNGAMIAAFVYDGDGKRVKSVTDGKTILFAGAHFELNDTANQATKYYFAGSARIAIRKYVVPQNMTLEYLLGDHLGSTSITTNAVGTKISELRYKAWGETRYTWTNAPANTSPVYELVKYQYTGQYSYDAEFGLKYYGARFYDSATGRFVGADTVIPLGTQGYDRFAYTNNNPLRYTDPSGHCPICLGLVLVIAGGILLGGDTPTAEALATAQTHNAIESISKNATTDVEKITSMFTGNTLPGDTPKARLDSVLTGTANGFGRQFFGDFGDSGFAAQFKDGNDQVGHFLTAVGIGYRNGAPGTLSGNFGLSMIVGHEMIPDYGGSTSLSQIAIGMMSPAEREAFMSGTEGGFQQVYDSGFSFKTSFGIFGRGGNSMEDIRLSYWGWYLGMLIANDCFQSNEEVATWIEDHISNGSTEMSSCLQ